MYAELIQEANYIRGNIITSYDFGNFKLVKDIDFLNN